MLAAIWGLKRGTRFDIEGFEMCITNATVAPRRANQLAWHLRRPISRFKPGPKDVVQFLKGYHQAAPQSAADLKALVWRMKAVLPPEPLLERPKRN